jgi:adenylyltransferase/sulfurtransferase
MRLKVPVTEDFYYLRQVTLPEFGKEGQKKLKNSRVAVVGLGGLGAIAAMYLARSGVGELLVIDNDRVELLNVHRQILYDPEDVGLYKVDIAIDKLAKMNPLIKVEGIREKLTMDNVEDVLENVDVIVDGLDNMEGRYAINRYSVKHSVPFIFTGAIGLEGNIAIFHPPDTPCFECVFGGLGDEDLPATCDRGILTPTPAVFGVIEALETIKLLTGVGNTLKGKLLYIDLKYLTFDLITLHRPPSCPICRPE